ncbi:MAG: flagellar hook-associated protein FlgL, partial [Defluviitaleaceae bacterium]|nr:flagellar hook-associated protein FlgL [Defluviitaleaceae bacterium]
MRITNSMTTNRLLMNLNRNANNVDRLFMQLSSGKVIQRPSDNPIIASRALRFRTNVAEVQQHQRNVAQAQSWMEVSEQNLQNTTEILTRTRSELMVQGASGTYTFQNRQSIVRVAELLFQQMKTELNGTFAGRYVFSGFRTNQPPIVTQNNISTAPGITPANDVNFEITKNITRQNIQDAGAVFWRNANPIVASPPDPPIPPADVAVGGTVDAAW